MAEIVAWLIVKWRHSTIRYYSRLPFSSKNELTYSVVRSTSNVLGVESPYCHGVYFARFFSFQNLTMYTYDNNGSARFFDNGRVSPATEENRMTTIN